MELGLILPSESRTGQHNSRSTLLAAQPLPKWSGAAGHPLDAAVMVKQIDQLALMSGRYELSAAIYDAAAVHAYDHHHRRYPLRVRASQVGEQYGLVHMPARWRHQPLAEALPAADRPEDG